VTSGTDQKSLGQPAWLSGDLIAGIVVWALIIPEGLAYAGLVSVPVQCGLYAIPLAGLGYAIFGTSKRETKR
jgi:MFS superfamily sulfate permease-like transporter